MTHTQGEPAPAGEDQVVAWLSPHELTSWLAIARLTLKLPWALDVQLRRDADLSLVEYISLAMLSDEPDHTMRMSELAEVTNSSLSRLSHLVKRLEQRDLMRREPDPDDGRFTNAILTTAGQDKLRATAPGHVNTVRRLVIDVLGSDRLHGMGGDAQRIVDEIDTPV